MRAFIVRFTLAVLLTVSGWAATGAPFAGQVFQGISDPRSLAGLAVWYDTSDVSSMLVSEGVNPTTGQAVKLIADKSGNSAVNCLVLNGVAGNYGSAPDSAAVSITGDIDIRARLAMADWTPGGLSAIVAKRQSDSIYSYALFVDTAGKPALGWSPDGTLASGLSQVSTAATGFADFSTNWIRVTLDVDNGAGGYDVKFYTSSDGVNWTQLGTTIMGASTTSIADTAAPLEIGTRGLGTLSLNIGNYYRAQIYNGINGTLAFDADFTAQSKLAPSFTESSANAATVTINTTGATGARISGERDLYQGTAASQPVLTIAAGGNYETLDGSDDFQRSPAFSHPQPITRFTVGRHVTWTSGDYLWDGASAANTGALIQTTTTPQLNMNAGSSVAANTDFTLNTRFIFTEVINSASSSLQANRLTATTGNAGAGVPNGITIGASGAATAANFGNILFGERVEYSRVLSAAEINAVQLYLARKWSIALP